MKKVLICITFALCIFLLVGATVYADNNTTINVIGSGSSGAGCSDLLASNNGESATELIREVLGYIRIIAPVLLIILTAADFSLAVIQQDNDALKKASSKVVKRSLMAIAIFLVPTIIRAILGLPGIKDAIDGTGSSDPFCGAIPGHISIGK